MFLLFIFRIYLYFQFRIAHIGAAEISSIVRAFVVHHIFVLTLFQINIKYFIIFFSWLRKGTLKVKLISVSAPAINNWTDLSIQYTITMKYSLGTQLLSAFNLAVALIIDLTKNLVLDEYHENCKAEAEQCHTLERRDI